MSEYVKFGWSTGHFADTRVEEESEVSVADWIGMTPEEKQEAVDEWLFGSQIDVWTDPE